MPTAAIGSRLVRVGVAGLVALAVIAGTAMLVPPVRDEIEWRWASYQDTAEAYDTYRAAWPGGRHVDEARALADDRWFARASAIGTLDGLEGYLRDHPAGAHVDEAREAADGLRWDAAVAAGTVFDLERYLRESPTGGHAAEAERTIDGLRWADAAAAGTVEAFETYLRHHPDGLNATAARDGIDDLHWRAAQDEDTVVSYRDYLGSHASGRRAADAEARIAALLVDDALYRAAAAEGTRDAIERFLAAYPGHRREPEARAVLRDIEGRDLFDLIAERKVTVTAKGLGIQAVELTIRRRVPYEITVRIPVGTQFVPARSSVQTMTATREQVLSIGGDEAFTIVDVACADIERAVPGETDRFTIRRGPAQLRRLFADPDHADARFAVRQAAVWIVTDDARFEALGRLLSFGPDSVERAIDVEEAAEALRLVDEAGIDIRRRAIWRDRSRILRGLPEGELRTWLAAKIDGA